MLRNYKHLLLAGALLIAPAYATTMFSIVPVTLNPAQGDVNDVFDVLLTNNDLTSAINVASFEFQVTTTDTDIMLTGGDTATTAATYIFTGDSFDVMNSFPLPTQPPNLPGQTLLGSDLTNSGSDVSVAAGATVGLGEIFYNVSPTATLGLFTLSFSGGITDNNLSDSAGDSIPVDNMPSTTLEIGPELPEPSSLLLLGSGLIALLYKARRQSTD